MYKTSCESAEWTTFEGALSCHKGKSTLTFFLTVFTIMSSVGEVIYHLLLCPIGYIFVYVYIHDRQEGKNIHTEGV